MKEKYYDVYVSYPPSVDKERINACLRDNLPENQADDLIQALAERPQAIIAENCSKEERENAQHYFSYLGLDVIIRHSLELILEENQEEDVKKIIDQCPVCRTIIEDSDAIEECPTCHLHFATATDTVIERKRIEWEEKVAFERKKQQEIALKLQLEKQEEEKRLRKQIRAELEQKLIQERGGFNWRSWFKGTKALISIGIILLVVFILIAIGYLIASFMK